MTASARDGFSWPDFEHAIASAYPVIYRRLAGRYHDPQLAEEVAWDSLTRAFEKLCDDPHYFDERNLTEWSSQLAGWRALDRLRRRTRTPSLAGADCRIEPGQQDAQALVWECLQRLDADDRDLLYASYYDDLGDQAIGVARYTDGTETARGLRVWRRRQKAQARLRDLLLEAGYEPPLDALAPELVGLLRLAPPPRGRLRAASRRTWHPGVVTERGYPFWARRESCSDYCALASETMSAIPPG